MRSTLAGLPGKETELLTETFWWIVTDANTRQVVGLPFEKNFLFEPTKGFEKCSQLVLGNLGKEI